MIHTPVYIMLSLIRPVISVTYQRYHHVIMHEVAILDKMQRFPHCQVVVPHVASLPNIGPDQSVMLQKSAASSLSKDTFKRPLQNVRRLKTLKAVDSVLIHVSIISPHWCQRHKTYSDAVEITLKKLN